MRGGAVLGDFVDLATDFEVAVRIFRIDEGDGDTRIVADILVLLPAQRGVDNHLAVGKVDPHRSGLRTTIGHQGSETTEGFFLEEVFVALRHGNGHVVSPLPRGWRQMNEFR